MEDNEEVTKRVCTVVMSDIMEEELEIIVIRKKVFECNYCQKTFQLKFYLNQHRLVHKGETRPFICNVCGKRYAKQEHISYHKRTHSAKRHFECPVCKKSFKFRKAMRLHQKIHEKNRPKDYQCKECGESFLHKQSLVTHQLAHLNQKLYKCEFCDREFRTKEGCQQHELTHSSEKLFRCKICSKKFSTYENMHNHSLLHKKKQFACKDCPKTFIFLINLERHVLWHESCRENTPWPYVCKLCKSSFSGKSYLDKHLRVCNEEYKPKQNTNKTASDFIPLNGCTSNSTAKLPISPKSIASGFSIQSERVINKSSACSGITPKSTASDFVRLNSFTTNSIATGFSTSNSNETAEPTIDSIQPNSSICNKLNQPKKVKLIYRCCNKSFDTKEKLQKHKEVHNEVRKIATPAKLYYCADCCVEFENQFLLDDHNYQFHDGNFNSYGCVICKIIFTTMEQLFKHGLEKHQAKYLAAVTPIGYMRRAKK